MSDSGGGLNRLAHPFVVFVERFYPEPLVFVIGMTALAFVGAVAWTPASPGEALVAWGEGLSSLLAFTAQLSITLVTANALARVDAIERAIAAVASVPRSGAHAYALVAVGAGLASLVAWPLGLVVGAMLARGVARTAASRGLRVDYPLLVASAYAGFVVWHMGYSGSAPLFVATPGHAMEAMIGVIPVSETIGARWNLLLIVLVLFAVALTCAAMAPAGDDIVVVSADVLEAKKGIDEGAPGDGEAVTPGDRLSHSRLGSGLLGAAVAAYLVSWFAQEGFALTLDVVNWSFLAAGLLLARSPAHYVALATEGGRSVGALLVQYPLYAGIMGLLAGTGAVDLLSELIAAGATRESLPLWGFFSGGVVNLFVPSGGGQWAIQGPIFLEAGARLGTDPALVVMSVAYGDQWTNLVQPFWTIPLLAIAGLRVRDVMGYAFVVLVVTGVIFAGGLAWVART